MKKKVLNFGVYLLVLIGIVFAISFYYSREGLKNTEVLNSIEVKAKVLSVDDSEVISSGYSNIGFQSLEVEVLEGEYKEQVFEGTNNLVGQTDIENIFKVGDKIIAALIFEDNKVDYIKAIDLYRQDALFVLFGLFVAALVLYAGVVGVKALISFVLTVFILWEVLVKQVLNGADPIITTTLSLMLLSAVIIFLVAGVNRKGISAFLGTISGLFITLIVTLIFGDSIGLYGLTQPYVNALVFSGYYNLNIREIFYSAIILGASGAAMDIAMDIAASMDEIKAKKPDIETGELIKSGFNVGRHVIGTMATTLLLAYSGGYLTLLMMFKIKGASVVRMVNLKIVASEIMRTVIGSIGLVLVAPITAIAGGVILNYALKENADKKADKNYDRRIDAHILETKTID